LSYKKAVNFAEKNLGPEDGITQNLKSVYENAKSEVSKNDFKNNLFQYSSTWLFSKKEKKDLLVSKEERRGRKREATSSTWAKMAKDMTN
ncbi:MAG: hypothetical protein ACKO96_27375, partial [Flammeovirgaceae bacterium]